jgi:tRNA(adenine34) deaminase
MIEAIKLAKRALKVDEVPVGAVVVCNNKIIAKAHNLTESKCNPTFHAEILALTKAAKKLSTNKLVECDLYVTLEPCPMCAHAISLSRIRRLYFGAFDPKGGGVENGAKIFNSSSCHHKPEVYGGILESECAEVLKNFFELKR